MSKTNTWENELLLLVFNNTAVEDIGDENGLGASETAGSLYVSLHTADPTEAGNQTSNEADYGSYARVAVARSDSGWTVSGNQVTNAATISFPQCTAGENTITHVGIGTASAGEGKLLYYGALGSSLAVSANITPTFNSSGLSITED